MNQEKLHDFMNLALQAAAEAEARGEVPVGALIINNGKIVSKAFGNAGRAHHDPTAHAEILAIRAACSALNQHRLDGMDLVVTLEPCPMCAAAIAEAHLARVYFGAYDPKGGGIEHGPRIFTHTLHKPEVYGGVREAECRDVLKDFFKIKR
jgi:tRNA(adenine34) deaminase